MLSHKEGQTIPEMSDEKLIEISERYIELFENITGDHFERSDLTNLEERIERNVIRYLQSI